VARSVKEWIGASDDTKVPPRVRARVFAKHNGICHLSKTKILPGMAWECDHIIPIIQGGQNRETNLAPALKDKHDEKSAGERSEKKVVARKRAKHLGIKQPAGNIKSPGFTKPEPQAKARKPLNKQMPPRRSLYERIGERR
jgi:5-methylcytosine-specific restriction protein A